jgi:nucleoside-diphosphate-sugar epimerase
MKILVTGGVGYIGSVLAPSLLKENHDVTIYDSLIYGGGSILPLIPDKRFSLIKGDIRDKNQLAAAIKNNEVIIHLAAIVGLPACNNDNTLAKEVNVNGTKNVVNCLSPDQYLIFASSVSNYGSFSGDICTEETPLNPISCYGETKAEAETIANSFNNTVSLRFASAFGVSPRMRLDLLINDFVYKAYTDKTLLLFEKSFKRTFAHVSDISHSIIFTLQNIDRMKQSIFNVGDNSNNISKEDIALMIKQRIDYHLQYVDYIEDEDKRNYSVSYEKISSFGYKTQKTVEEGIDELIKACKVFEFKHPFKNF